MAHAAEAASSAGAACRARAAEADRRDEAAAAKAAYEPLRVDVSSIAAEVERAERAVNAAIEVVLQPTARRLFDEARSLRLEFLKRVYAVDTMRALLPPDLDEEKQRLLTFIAPELITFIAPELMAASRIVQQNWGAAIERSRRTPTRLCRHEARRERTFRCAPPPPRGDRGCDGHRLRLRRRQEASARKLPTIVGSWPSSRLSGDCARGKRPAASCAGQPPFVGWGRSCCRICCLLPSRWLERVFEQFKSRWPFHRI